MRGPIAIPNRTPDKHFTTPIALFYNTPNQVHSVFNNGLDLTVLIKSTEHSIQGIILVLCLVRYVTIFKILVIITLLEAILVEACAY